MGAGLRIPTVEHAPRGTRRRRRSRTRRRPERPDTLRAGAVLDPAAATRRAQAILAASGYSGAVTVDGSAVTVTVTGSVVYAFPSPGFPDQVTGTASAIARRGVTGTEGG
jgi:hypothetical protein